jgi:EAL and modified HD-GYP domain-containing signal transduction protein
MTTEIPPHESSSDTRFIARQPILDLSSRVHGYALLFDTAADGVIGGKNRDAARAILDDMVLLGLDRLTGGEKAFLRCTSEVLTEKLVEVLPPESTVLEIPDCVKQSSHLIDACRELKAAGFQITLVDFKNDSEPHPLLELASYIKIDITELDEAGFLQLRECAANKEIKLIASKVDSQELHSKACREGFSFFQGFYFCYPELILTTKVPANRLFHFEILRQLQSDPLNIRKIGPLVMRDASLVLRLLRLVNSPICAIRQEVTSIESAIMILGETTFRRIANLAILREFNADQPSEILHMALVRGRFCELAAAPNNLDPGEQYLLGMLSLLPAMLRYPMESLAKELPLRAEIRQALLGEANAERSLLGWIEFHERNMVPECLTLGDKYGMNQQKLNQFYVDALIWDAATPRVIQ